MNTGALLTVDEISVHYGQALGVRCPGLEVSQGEAVGVFGPNGAGKSTLAGAIAGLLPSRSARFEFDGADISGESTQARVRRGLVLVPQDRALFTSLSVGQNLRLGGMAASSAVRSQQLDLVLDLFPVLKDRLNQKAGSLSGGEQQMLAIGRGLMSAPRLLILDEPSTGLSPGVSERVYGALREVLAQGSGLIVIEQQVALAASMVSRAHVLAGQNQVAMLDGVSVDPETIANAYFASSPAKPSESTAEE